MLRSSLSFVLDRRHASLFLTLDIVINCRLLQKNVGDCFCVVEPFVPTLLCQNCCCHIITLIFNWTVIIPEVIMVVAGLLPGQCTLVKPWLDFMPFRSQDWYSQTVKHHANKCSHNRHKAKHN